MKPAILRRGGLVGAALLAALVGTPGVAFAHGVGAAADTVPGFVWVGLVHMLLGWDHLLFIAGVVLLAGQVKRSAKLISLFAAGHSATLIAATLAEWQVSAVAVDVVIALSVVFVGVVGWIGRPADWRWFAAAVLGFGLVHGLGLATRLQELGLPQEGMLWRVIAFNIGVELGQLAAVVAMVGLGLLLRRYLTWSRARQATHAGLIAAGLVAAVVLSVSAVVGGDAAQAMASESCQQRKRNESYRNAATGGHPTKDFFEPAEAIPESSFGHILFDGYLVVHYQPTLPAEQLAQLRDFVTGPDGNRVVAGATPGQTETIKAVNAYTTMICTDFDLLALRQFTRGWFDDPRSRPSR